MHKTKTRTNSLMRQTNLEMLALALITILFTASLKAQTLAPGQAPVAPIKPANISVLSSQEYLISPDDLLDVYLIDVPELSREYRVSSTGDVTVPLLPKPLSAAGLTLPQFADLIAKELKDHGMVSDPRVTVTVKESRTNSVVISGEVKRPQLYFVFGRTNLLDILSQAEGLADNAGPVVNIIRGEMAIKVLNAKKEDASPLRTIDLEKLLAGDAQLNIDIYPGDHVTVPAAGVVYVVGAVNHPGGFPLTGSQKQLTVLQAVALASDVKSTAKPNDAVILRRGEQYPGGQKEIPIKLKEILRGKAEDVQLAANDILFVPDSTGKRALLRGAETILQIGTGLAIVH